VCKYIVLYDKVALDRSDIIKPSLIVVTDFFAYLYIRDKSSRRIWYQSRPRTAVMVNDDTLECWRGKAGISRRRHRHRHPRDDPRRHVRHARFPEVIPMASWSTRRHSHEDPREVVGEDSVSVSVSAPWNASLTEARFVRPLSFPGLRRFVCYHVQMDAGRRTVLIWQQQTCNSRFILIRRFQTFRNALFSPS